MARGHQRRASVFVDFSSLRDALRKWLPADISQRYDANSVLDYEKLGRWLCGDEREFIRMNLYTGTPVAVDEREGGVYVGNVEAHEHEAYKARGVQRSFQRLQDHIDHRARFTRLATGRMVARRVELRHGPAFEWAQQILEAVGEAGMSAEDRTFFEEAARVNHEAREARDRLSARIVELREQGRIPGHLMPVYTWRLAELLGEQLEFTEKGVDTLLTVEMLEHCMNDAYDDAVLFASDEDYIPLVEAVKRTGRHVIHAFWDVGNPGWALRKACDAHVIVTRDVLDGIVGG